MIPITLALFNGIGKEGKQILKKLATLDNPEVAITIITYEEQVRGRLLFISKARTVEQ